MNTFIRFFAFVFTLGFAHAAQAANYKICISWQVQTTDSGPSGWAAEDHWSNGNGGRNATARGVLIDLLTSSGGFINSVYTDQSGCYSFSSSSSTFDVRVYAKQKLPSGAIVRTHDDWSDIGSNPGLTYSYYVNNVTPTPSGSNRYYVGFSGSVATAQAAAGWTLYRMAPSGLGSLNGKYIHMGIDWTNVNGPSSLVPSDATSFIDPEGDHKLTLQAVNARQKFVVSHEVGHALARLYYGKEDGNEPGQSFGNSTTPNAAACTSTAIYSMFSKEWSAVGWKEGFAHFVSARTWHNSKSSAWINWFGTVYDSEKWGTTNSTGGTLKNVCCTAPSNCTSSWSSAGTNEDWFRFFWDFHTDAGSGCSSKATIKNMFDLYYQTRDNGGILSTNAYDKMRSAADDLSPGMPTCVGVGGLTAKAAWNGIDTP